MTAVETPPDVDIADLLTAAAYTNWLVAGHAPRCPAARQAEARTREAIMADRIRQARTDARNGRRARAGDAATFAHREPVQWDPQAGQFVPRANPWLAAAYRAATGSLTPNDRALIERRLPAVLADADTARDRLRAEAS